jgi:2-oxoglutarate ferredoxin oxidoreductase subunit alpha
VKLDQKRIDYLQKFTGRKDFLLGDEACAYGALYAGCSFFGAYPITPASEVAETAARELPYVDSYFVQFEDEIASISSIIGAAWAGARSMTATSGPGFSLMQEGIGYAVMTETPCVIVDIQRSGPSTGQATKGAQGDFYQARWGTHGDHEIIALAPNSVQEYFDLTIDCFNLAETYRSPVILLGDGEVGHMRENITFPDPSDIEIEPRRKIKNDEPHMGGEPVPPMLEFGEGTLRHVTGSTHKPDGMRDVNTQSVHEQLVRRLVSKIGDAREEIVRVEETQLDDAEVVIIAYGAASRPAMGAVEFARKNGLPVGMLRLITVWPFPQTQVAEIGKSFRKIVVPEMCLGQLSREIERFVPCPVISVPKIGGISHTVAEIYTAIEESLQ